MFTFLGSWTPEVNKGSSHIHILGILGPWSEPELSPCSQSQSGGWAREQVGETMGEGKWGDTAEEGEDVDLRAAQHLSMLLFALPIVKSNHIEPSNDMIYD